MFPMSLDQFPQNFVTILNDFYKINFLIIQYYYVEIQHFMHQLDIHLLIVIVYM